MKNSFFLILVLTSFLLGQSSYSSSAKNFYVNLESPQSECMPTGFTVNEYIAKQQRNNISCERIKKDYGNKFLIVSCFPQNTSFTLEVFSQSKKSCELAVLHYKAGKLFDKKWPKPVADRIFQLCEKREPAYILNGIPSPSNNSDYEMCRQEATRYITTVDFNSSMSAPRNDNPTTGAEMGYVYIPLKSNCVPMSLTEWKSIPKIVELSEGFSCREFPLSDASGYEHHCDTSKGGMVMRFSSTQKKCFEYVADKRRGWTDSFKLIIEGEMHARTSRAQQANTAIDYRKLVSCFTNWIFSKFTPEELNTAQTSDPSGFQKLTDQAVLSCVLRQHPDGSKAELTRKQMYL